jgi:hypothetical protein
MEWKHSKGEIIPPTSKSHSQCGDKLFNLKITPLLRDGSHRNVTCCLQNPVTDQEERTNIVLAGENYVFVQMIATVIQFINRKFACPLLFKALLFLDLFIILLVGLPILFSTGTFLLCLMMLEFPGHNFEPLLF